MSVASEVNRIQAARNAIRGTLVSWGVAQSGDDLDALAAALASVLDRGAVDVTLDEGQTYTVPQGYHNGSGTVANPVIAGKMEPYVYDYNSGYVQNGTWHYENPTQTYADIYRVVAGGSYFLRGFGRLYGQSIEYTAAGTPVYDSIVPSMLASLPDLMIGVVIILVLSASMSTLSSLVLTSGSTLTLDIIDPAVAKVRKGVRMNDRRQLLCIRLLVLFFILVSSVLAIVQAKSSVTFIAQLMGISWGALAGAFLAPFLYGLYWKRTTSASVWASFIAGVAVMCGCMYCTFTGKVFISPYFTSPINAGVLAMLLGLVIVPVVSLVSRMGHKEEVRRMFACYDNTVVVHASTSLVDEEN